MTSIEVHGAVVVATMRDVAGRIYEADAPVLDGRGELPMPLGRLVSYLHRLAILIRPDDFLSGSRCSQRLRAGPEAAAGKDFPRNILHAHINTIISVCAPAPPKSRNKRKWRCHAE